jgi:sirohydrochlorin cobaltochelatase
LLQGLDAAHPADRAEWIAARGDLAYEMILPHKRALTQHWWNCQSRSTSDHEELENHMTAVQDPALLLIAHGTRNPAGATEMQQLLGHLRQRLEPQVAAAWLEDFAEPDAVTAAAELIASGASHLVTLPFLVLGAGHAKTDVPAAVHAITAAFPQVTVSHGRVLGLHPSLFELARARVLTAAGRARASASEPGGGDLSSDRGDEALLVTGAGSSDPDANGDLSKAARVLGEQTGHRWVETAYAGVTWPRADQVLTRLHRAGVQRVVRFSWSLLAGVLEQRVDGWASEAVDQYGIEIVDAGRFGPDPLVAGAVVDRYHEAIHGDARMNCDLCAYRLPLPGLESRAGAPSAGGLGLAVHRHTHG